MNAADFLGCQCKSGFVRDLNTTKCVCPAGFTLDNENCVNCGADSFKETIGNEGCKQCSRYAVKGSFSTTMPATSRHNCTCAKFEYLNPLRNNEDDENDGDGDVDGDDVSFVGECRICPEGGICNKVANTLESMQLEKGYWRSAKTSNKIVECYTKGACAQNSSKLGEFDFSIQCKEGHYGPICGICEDSFSMSVAGVCEPCDSEVVVPKRMIGTFILVVLLAALFVFKTKKKYDDEKRSTTSSSSTRGTDESAVAKLTRIQNDR